MNRVKLTIVRHGRTDWNAEGTVQGSIDRPLDGTGIQEALQLYEELQHLPITKVCSSDLQRAFRTAEIIAQRFSHSVEAHRALREVSYGQIEGQLWKEFRLHYKEKISEYEGLSWEERKKFKYTETSESYGEVLDRVIPFLHGLCTQNTLQHMMVVTHGGVIKALIAELTGADDRRVHTKNTGFMTLSFTDGNLVLEDSKGIELNWENK